MRKTISTACGFVSRSTSSPHARVLSHTHSLTHTISLTHTHITRTHAYSHTHTHTHTHTYHTQSRIQSLFLRLQVDYCYYPKLNPEPLNPQTLNPIQTPAEALFFVSRSTQFCFPFLFFPPFPQGRTFCDIGGWPHQPFSPRFFPALFFSFPLLQGRDIPRKRLSFEGGGEMRKTVPSPPWAGIGVYVYICNVI